MDLLARGIVMTVVAVAATCPLSGCDDPVDVGGPVASSARGAGGGAISSSSSSASSGGMASASSAGGAGGDSCPDADGDGVTVCAGDCDDSDATVFPGHPEICGDAKDNDCNGSADDTCGGLGTFVSSTGSDTNPGTQALPLRTIAKGIDQAIAIGNGVDVYVAAGTYAESVAVVEGVSLYGGWAESPNGWTHDVDANPTTIACPTFRCVEVPSTVTRDTTVDGFTIEGLAGQPSLVPGSVAVAIEGGSPILSHDKIHGGAVSGVPDSTMQLSVGVEIVAPTPSPGPLLDSNEIVGGTSVGGSNGVLFDAPVRPATMFSTAEIVHSTITAGDALTTVGIDAWASAAGTVVRDNDIGAGHSDGGGSWGVSLESELVLDKNRINADPNSAGSCNYPPRWCGGVVSSSATSTITNNVILGAKSNETTGMLLVASTSAVGVARVNGNYIGGGQPGSGFILKHSVAIVVRNESGGTVVLGHIRNNILDGGHCDKRYGIYEDDTQLDPSAIAQFEVLENNDLYFPPPNQGTDYVIRIYQGNPDTAVEPTLIGVLNGLPGAANNFINGPMTDLSYHLMAGSPCIDKGTLTEAPPDDMDGEPRPKGAGIDVGPDERM